MRVCAEEAAPLRGVLWKEGTRLRLGEAGVDGLAGMAGLPGGNSHSSFTGLTGSLIGLLDQD